MSNKYHRSYSSNLLCSYIAYIISISSLWAQRIYHLDLLTPYVANIVFVILFTTTIEASLMNPVVVSFLDMVRSLRFLNYAGENLRRRAMLMEWLYWTRKCGRVWNRLFELELRRRWGALGTICRELARRRRGGFVSYGNWSRESIRSAMVQVVVTMFLSFQVLECLFCRVSIAPRSNFGVVLALTVWK